MNEVETQAAIRERRIDVALMTRHTLWPDAVTAPLYRERLLVALPRGHPLAARRKLNWATLSLEGDRTAAGPVRQWLRPAIFRRPYEPLHREAK